MDYRDPCCGLPLYRGVKVIAVIDLVTSIFAAVLYGFGFLIALFDGDAIIHDLDNNNGTKVIIDGTTMDASKIEAGWLIVGALAGMVLSGLYIFLARYLLHGIQERNTVKLQRWFDITVVILAVRLLGFIPMLFYGGGAIILFGIMWCTYTAYSLWVVHTFRKNLLMDGESNLLRDAVYYSRFGKI